MALNYSSEQRSGPRYVVSLPVRAEWDDAGSGEHVVVEGETENVGPAGALVHLEHLPDVGSRVQLVVLDEHERSTKVQAGGEGPRGERKPAQPLAALQLMKAS